MAETKMGTQYLREMVEVFKEIAADNKFPEISAKLLALNPKLEIVCTKIYFKTQKGNEQMEKMAAVVTAIVALQPGATSNGGSSSASTPPGLQDPLGVLASPQVANQAAKLLGGDTTGGAIESHLSGTLDTTRRRPDDRVVGELGQAGERYGQRLRRCLRAGRAVFNSGRDKQSSDSDRFA